MSGTPRRPGRIVPALCSVTFRDLEPEGILRLAAENGIEAVEWGADVHVPPGDVVRARRVGDATRAAGLRPVSCGSYVRAGDEDSLEAFGPVLASAKALGAGNVRVWAGRRSGRDAGAAEVARIARDLDAMATSAEAEGITVSVEYHRNTQTEHVDDARALLESAGHGNLFTYWQPVPGRGRAAWLAELETLRPHLGYLHVFHWIAAEPKDERRPLSEGRDDWQALLAEWAPAPRWPHGRAAMLEFVAGDDPDAFAADAAELRRLCAARDGVSDRSDGTIKPKSQGRMT